MVDNRVVLDIPKNLKYQLVYRLKTDTSIKIESKHKSSEFNIVGKKNLNLKLAFLIKKTFGFRSLLKIVLSNSYIYYTCFNREIVSYGWVQEIKVPNTAPAESKWFRKVIFDEGVNDGGRTAMVLGSIGTYSDYRGMGFAYYSMANVINHFLDVDKQLFYIDTAGDNIAMQKVIDKCGFGRPVACLLRRPMMQRYLMSHRI